jgi:hypothetical protein
MENLLSFTSFLFLAFCFFYLLLDTTTVSIESVIKKIMNNISIDFSHGYYIGKMDI